MYEEAFEAGVADMVRVNELRKIQDEEKKSFDALQQELREQCEQDGETFKLEKKIWEEIKPRPF